MAPGRRGSRLYRRVIAGSDLAAIASREELDRLFRRPYPDPLAATRRRLSGILADTPRGRLRWLIENFVHIDLARLREDPTRGLWHRLVMQVEEITDGRWTVETTESDTQVLNWEPEEPERTRRKRARKPLIYQDTSAEELREAQQRLREVLDQIVEGRTISESARVRFLMAGGSHVLVAPLADAILAAILVLLEKVPQSRLRRCAYSAEGGPECGRLFVATKGQKYCSFPFPVRGGSGHVRTITHRTAARLDLVRASQARHREARRHQATRRPSRQRRQTRIGEDK